MSNDDSVVKSFRTNESQFNTANEIFKKEGFSLSEVIRMLLEATIREGRIPRGLSGKDTTSAKNSTQVRNNYVDSILNMAFKSDTLPRYCYVPENLTDEELYYWAAKWGLPDDLSVATLNELYFSDLFNKNPWSGDFSTYLDAEKELQKEKGLDAITLMRFQENIKSNLEQMKQEMQKKAIQYLYKYTKGE